MSRKEHFIFGHGLWNDHYIHADIWSRLVGEKSPTYNRTALTTGPSSIPLGTGCAWNSNFSSSSFLSNDLFWFLFNPSKLNSSICVGGFDGTFRTPVAGFCSIFWLTGLALNWFLKQHNFNKCAKIFRDETTKELFIRRYCCKEVWR